MSRTTRIASKVADAWGFGASPEYFQVGDLVRLTGFSEDSSGIVCKIDVKARKVLVRLHQSMRSVNHPIQFEPEELFLVWRSKEEIDTPVIGYPGMDELQKQVSRGDIE